MKKLFHSLSNNGSESAVSLLPALKLSLWPACALWLYGRCRGGSGGPDGGDCMLGPVTFLLVMLVLKK